jgi:hypothetical protein
MTVDKSWRQYEPTGIESCICLPMPAVTQVDNAIAVDGDVDKL